MENHVTKPGWFSRNWKWAVPLGCLGTMVMFVGFIAAIFVVIMGAMRASDAYQIAMSRARQHPAVVDALGEPIEGGWFVSGNISVSGASGEADLSVPLSGPQGSGTLYVVADKVAGEWIFERMEVAFADSGERVNLLPRTGRRELGVLCLLPRSALADRLAGGARKMIAGAGAA